uniref:Uncharacterized protein n=1 Tax=Anguilla anguilla TaxID=7936 RepID=A0A0E9W092_ANGAN
MSKGQIRSMICNETECNLAKFQDV